MNKKEIGNYLRELRKLKKRRDGKSFSQFDLANEISSIKGNAELSVNAIEEWESGKAIPSTEHLTILAKIYNKTIEELLECEETTEMDYKEKYFLCDDNWMKKFGANDLYLVKNEQIRLITSRFRELLFSRIKRYWTNNEDKEIKFLFCNFYELSDYARNLSSININDEFLIFKDAINKLLIRYSNKSYKYIYWEIQKLYSEKKNIRFSFWNDVYELKKTDILKSRFAEIEDWQKDMLLAMFQVIDPYDDDPAKYGSTYFKRYESNYGEYNHDEIVKNEIKELIARGACLNQCFFVIKRKFFEKKRIIDKLEELYNICLKPIEINVFENENQIKTYKIENNPKNRFLKNYYFPLKMELMENNQIDNYENIDELYNWFCNAESVTDDIWLKVAKKHKIDVQQEKKYWMADIKQVSLIEKKFNEFKNTEKDIINGLKEIEELRNKLDKGDNYYLETKYEIIGGKDEESIRNCVENWKTRMDYLDFLNGRDKNKTKELLNNIDNYSLKELRAKFFAIEEVEDE